MLVNVHITLSMLVWLTSDISTNERRHRLAQDGIKHAKHKVEEITVMLRKLSQQAAGACNAYSHHMSAV